MRFCIKGPKLSSFSALQTTGHSLPFARPPLPSPVSIEPTSNNSHPDSTAFVHKLKSVCHMTLISALYTAKVIPILKRNCEVLNFEISDEAKLDLFMSAYHTVTSRTSFQSSPSPVGFVGSPSIGSASPGNELTKELHYVLRSIAFEMFVRISESTREKLGYSSKNSESFTVIGMDSHAYMAQQPCVVVSLFGSKLDISSADSYIDRAAASFTSACDLWHKHHVRDLFKRYVLLISSLYSRFDI